MLPFALVMTVYGVLALFEVITHAAFADAAGPADKEPYTPIKPNIIITNDDGWAEVSIRQVYESVTRQGYDALISAPSYDQSKFGRRDDPKNHIWTRKGCQYDSCPDHDDEMEWGKNTTSEDPFYVSPLCAILPLTYTNTLRHTQISPPPPLVASPTLTSVEQKKSSSETTRP